MDNITGILPSLTLHYNFVKQIGEGANGVVWSVMDNNGKLYACKIPLQNKDNLILQEASIMSKISKYPNKGLFLTFYGAYSYNNLIVEVMELFDGYQLSNLKIRLTEPQLLWMAKQLYSQLAYLNNLGLSHGDISLNNILYNETRIVFIDIGGQNYNIHTNDHEYAETTIEYWNKAIQQGYNRDQLMFKGDVFNLGKIFMMLMIGRSFDMYNYLQNPNIYKLNTEYKIMDIIVNYSIELDLSVRPTALQIVAYIDQLK